jgi:hypothetical protein
VPKLELDVRRNGLLVEGHVWLSPQRREAMFRKGLDVRPRIPVTLIIDTGADSTMLSTQLIRSLGLEVPINQTKVLTSGSRGVPEHCDIFDVELEIQGAANQASWRLPPLEVLARPLENQGTDGMIGRDVLKLGILHYDGPHNTFSLTYP